MAHVPIATLDSRVQQSSETRVTQNSNHRARLRSSRAVLAGVQGKQTYGTRCHSKSQEERSEGPDQSRARQATKLS